MVLTQQSTAWEVMLQLSSPSSLNGELWRNYPPFSLLQCVIRSTSDLESEGFLDCSNLEARVIKVALAEGSTRYTGKAAPVTVMMPMNCSSFCPADKAWKLTRYCEQSALRSDTDND